ncbi:unnamed protein product [Oncorhynchus mykiss]|uniref:GPCR family 3 nine cysteines domain-containing protein n=1 Tax=Oncorhynchus mykiss TaxID=8022 RepID=A0A060Y0H3_ONCMY|nr:unnamed protein product [Oncorhynchus mykiss]
MKMHLHSFQVLGALKDSCFELEGESYSFDQKGDINLGYDVTLWRSVRGVINVHDVAAEYHPINNSFSYTSGNTKNLTDLRDVVSVCSPSCEPGKFKKFAQGQHTCCYECINCTENHYSNNTGWLCGGAADTGGPGHRPGSPGGGALPTPPPDPRCEGCRGASLPDHPALSSGKFC